MKVSVKLFARACDLVGAELVELDVPDSCKIHDLKECLAARYPKLSPLIPNLLTAIDTEYATDDTPIFTDSDIACFPPVSGG